MEERGPAMPEWDPEGESQNPERDFRRDYAERSPGRRLADTERGVWSIGGEPRHANQPGQAEVPPPDVAPLPPASGAHTGKGPRGYCRHDARLYEEVCEALTRDGDVDASDVDVEVEGGEVTLSGTVVDRDMLRQAEDVVAACRGVRN